MLPYLFTIFGFHLPTYGLLVAIAFLVALALTAKLARRNGLDSEIVLNLGIYCAMAGIARREAHDDPGGFRRVRTQSQPACSRFRHCRRPASSTAD